LEARVGIEPTHKGFADRADGFGWVWTDLATVYFHLFAGQHPARYQSVYAGGHYKSYYTPTPHRG